MIDLPNTENLRAFAAAILRFQRLSEGIPESDHWRLVALRYRPAVERQI